MATIKGWSRNLLLAAGALLTLFLIWYFSRIVTYIFISLVLSFLGRPMMRWMMRIKFWKFRIPENLAAFITLIFILGLTIGFFWFIIPFLMTEIETLSVINFDAIFDYVREPLSRIARFAKGEYVTVDNVSFADLLRDRLNTSFDFSKLSNVLGFVTDIFGELFIGLISVSFITFFFLKEKDMFRNGVLLLVPTEFEEKVEKILTSISYLLRRYFIGLLFEVLIVMMLDTVGMLILGIEFQHAVIIGLFCGLFCVVPYVGPWIGSAIGLMIGTAINMDKDFMSFTLPLLGLMTGVFLIVKIFDNLILQPLIYSSSVKAHPLEVFLVIIAAGSMAGVIGMMLAIPIYTILRVVAKEFFDNMKIVKKLTENLDQEDNKIIPWK
jgi:predicted PurR-regulated permease PerM